MVNPLQAGRSSGLRSRLSGGGVSFKPGDVGYFRSNPGAGWILANAAQSIDSILYPKFRSDARSLYTTAQTDTNADANTNVYNGIKQAFRHTDNFVYFSGMNSYGNTLWQKTAWNAEPTLISTVTNPNSWWGQYKFCGIQNNIAVFIAKDTANTLNWGLYISTNAGFTTWSATIYPGNLPSEQIYDVLWTGTRWLVAGYGIYTGATISAGMASVTHTSGPVNVTTTRWGHIWKVGSIIYAQGADTEYWAKSLDDGLTWTTFLPTNGPYRHGEPYPTVQYSPLYNLWVGMTASNALVYTNDPTTTWTQGFNNIGGGYNWGLQILDMPDPGGILVCVQGAIHMLFMQNNTFEYYVHLSNYAFVGSYGPNAIFREGTVTYLGSRDTRWKRIYTPIERCNPPTIAAINGRTPYMRVSP